MDGMTIGLAVHRNPKEVQAAGRAWDRFLGILLRDLQRH